MKRNLIWAWWIPLVLGCSKEKVPSEEEYSSYDFQHGCPGFVAFEGLVVDSLNGNPIAGVQIWRPYGMPGYIGGISDSVGHYHAEIHYYKCAKTGVSLAPTEQPLATALSLDPGEAYHASEYVNLAGVPENSTLQRNIRALPYSYVNIHITGNSGAQSLAIRKKYLSSYTAIVPLGNTVDTTVVFKVHSDRTSEMLLYLGDSIYAVTPYLSGYGNAGELEIHYP